MQTPLTAQYQPIPLPVQPDVSDFRALRKPYQAMIVAQFRAIVDRSEAGPLYPWLDTRLDLITGADLPPADPRFGPGLVSGWVQGRGLEGLATFGAWLGAWAGSREADALLGRVRRLTAALLAQFRAARAQYGGHLYFTMLPDGMPITVDERQRQLRVAMGPDTPHNYSDLFAAKAMLAAAYFLGNEIALDEARAYCRAVYEDILSLRFRTDQPQPAGLASVVSTAGGYAHGPHMIALGMATHFACQEPGPASVEMGLRLARRVLYAHVNLAGRWPALRPNDLVEFITAEGGPHVDEAGRVIADPGHALEFVGLFLKFCAVVRQGGSITPEQLGEMAHLEGLMLPVLLRAFDNGFQPSLGGIRKSLDLLTLQSIDDTMPWWSLPETIRAGLAAAAISSTMDDLAACLSIAAQCHNAFVENYVRPDIHLMAIKLRDGAGRVSSMVPAYPDADPGYHTALSLIDALESLKVLEARAGR